MRVRLGLVCLTVLATTLTPVYADPTTAGLYCGIHPDYVREASTVQQELPEDSVLLAGPLYVLHPTDAVVDVTMKCVIRDRFGALIRDETFGGSIAVDSARLLPPGSMPYDSSGVGAVCTVVTVTYATLPTEDYAMPCLTYAAVGRS